MFLFHWCMNALRCRRDMTLETTPLSPAKYNGLPPALDSDLQRQLVYDMPTPSYDVTIINRPLLDVEDPVDSPGFFQDRLNPASLRVVDESAITPSTCHSESRDAVDSYFHAEEPTTSPLSSTLSTDDVTRNGINGHCGCECESADAVNENTEQFTYSFDVSSKYVPSLTQCYTLHFPQPHFNQEMQPGVYSSNEESSLLNNSDLSSNTQYADDVDFSQYRNSLCSGDVCVSDMSHRNTVSSFPVDTFQDPLITVAMLLVNSAVNAAVRTLNSDVTLASESNPVSEIVLPPVSSSSNSIQSLPSSDEPIKALEDPVEVAASRLVNYVLSEIERKSNSSLLACAQALPSEMSITTAVCAAEPQYSTSTGSRCESDSALTVDNYVESVAAAADAGNVLMPAAAEDYLSESSATVGSSVDQPKMLAAHEPVCAPNCDYNLVCALNDDFESVASLFSGRLTFVSPPFTDAYPPDDVSETLNTNTFVIGLFDDDDSCQRVSDNLRPDDHQHYTDNDAQPRVMCSTERDVDLSANSDADVAAVSSVDYGVSNDDSCPDIHTSLKQYTPECVATETWNSCESGYRPEDYFFRRYVIPVDQLDADEATSATDSDLSSDVMAEQNERSEQRTKMQLDLRADEQNHGTDLDADIAAVAAFCRAMFTPVEIETDDNDDKISPFDIVSNPETPDTEEGRAGGVRRCISLRTSPGTPHKKKSVRFADALGLDLEYVRQMETVDEWLPAFSGGDVGGGWARRPLLAEASAAWRRALPPVRRRYLCACFQEPGRHPDFIERVLQSRVVLENCDADDRALTITGVVRVANVAYHKTVAARVTTDSWATQTDVSADYLPRSNDGTTDRFSFQIVLPHGATDVGRRVEFAVYFTAFFDCDNRSETYWDNNFGANYCFECYAHNDGEAATLESDNEDDQFPVWSRFA